MENRSLVTIAEHSKEKILYLLEMAREFEKKPNRKILDGKVVATLFFEPSTRTRLSFETAANRLGARVIGFTDPKATSSSKGETLKDTIIMVSNYADIIVMRFVENCPKNDFDKLIFKKETVDLLQYLNPSKNAKIILTTGFWRHPADDGIVEIAEELNLPLVKLGDLGEKDEMKAIGLFEHSGVANHPGDLGMKEIADRIFEILKYYL